MPELTSIWEVIDSVVFVCGFAIGHSGKHGIEFLLHAMNALRGKEPGKQSADEPDAK